MKRKILCFVLLLLSLFTENSCNSSQKHSLKCFSVSYPGLTELPLQEPEPNEIKNVIFPDLYEYLTGIQYLNFIADIFKVSATDRQYRIETYAEEFEITASLGDLISSYSHGMKQKVAIISAVLHKPKLLVLDEPFVGLDPKASLVLKNIMKELCKEECSIFFSTHVLEVAQKLCNKIAIIKGDTEELTQNQSLEELFMEVVENEK